jgi:hypothetical protein
MKLVLLKSDPESLWQTWAFQQCLSLPKPSRSLSRGIIMSSKSQTIAEAIDSVRSGILIRAFVSIGGGSVEAKRVPRLLIKPPFTLKPLPALGFRRRVGY